MLQDPKPIDSFGARMFGNGNVAVFRNWTYCSNSGRDKKPFVVDILDSVDAPTYGERRYLELSANATAKNTFDERWQLKLLANEIKPVTESVYNAHRSHPDESQTKVLYGLRQTAATQLTVTMRAWKEARLSDPFVVQGVPFRDGVWEWSEGDLLKIKQTISGEYRPIDYYDQAFVPLPRRTHPQQLSDLGNIEVRYGNRSVLLDKRGFGNVDRPQVGIAGIGFVADLWYTPWGASCGEGNSNPNCPPLPPQKH